ncbi:MAG: hypothetical protein ALECFALPRED_002895 [Alectoria fallacina]|uniref:Uncharacterized protein n=1 Tax=Alectoria fallacina TaxID=1903189 RepID=A0A8H3FI81_9LECA|nr:MAG: hypothetical protein ALECFALPRED_002895 [Alectoria fallacina]
MSRFTVINEMSNGVTGTFVLHDLLSISTMSGSINITVVPQPASSSKAPAELVLNTASGSIKVTMAPFLHDPSTVTPERIFNSTLKSMSGSITAALVQWVVSILLSTDLKRKWNLQTLSRELSYSPHVSHNSGAEVDLKRERY